MVTLKLPNGKTTEGEQVDFELVKEGWSEFKLPDGTILKIKVAVSEIYKLDQTDLVTGKPNFLVRSKNLMSQIAPTG